MDYITRVCDMLEEVYKANPSKMYCNEIDCTKRVLESTIGNDYDRFLMIKAELEIHKNSSSHDFSLLSFMISIFSFITTGVALINKPIAACMVVLESIPVIVLCLCISWSSKTNRSKWRKYIAVVLEEFEKERFSK